ncbi:MAG: alpha-methylacyl-CoA racemase [Candidatus Eremiobacteraeota bacterium]|jgi:alpha-methylacyl-CoA racemase|nr:alpha-methylacyl-CoA racemase [Candidatus Eremiobacteraeota bacterium]
MSGPLDGVRVLEFAGMGPAPFCAMLLADLGADVVRVDRGDEAVRANLVRERGRTSLTLDLRSADGIELALAAIERADVLIEGFRPGVMERLGVGPDVALARNSRLIYGRMTGWGQDGPLARTAGHDLTYIAVTGALSALADEGARPAPPLNLVGDFGGGALYLAFGIAAALYERERSGRGQVIDAAIVDGTASLMANFSGTAANGERAYEMGRRILGGGAPNYRTYECADGRYVAVGPIEPKFYAILREKLGIAAHGANAPNGDPHGAEIRELEAVFKKRTRDEWTALLQDSDACFAPVMSFDEAPSHPQLRERGSYVEVDGVVQPAVAPRFSRTPGAIKPPDPAPDGGGRAALERWGVHVAPRRAGAG